MWLYNGHPQVLIDFPCCIRTPSSQDKSNVGLYDTHGKFSSYIKQQLNSYLVIKKSHKL